MIFQIVGEGLFYYNGRLNNSINLDTCSQTWDYHPTLKGRSIDYAKLFSGGLSLDEACPEDTKEKWGNLKKRIGSFKKTFATSKMNVSSGEFYRLLPEDFTRDLFNTREHIIRHVLETSDRPKNYQVLVDMCGLISKISQQSVSFDNDAVNLELQDVRVLNLKKKNLDNSKILYNNFGSKTGRLTTKKNSFPILTIDKVFRKFIKPRNDHFLELDYNAAEVRVFLGLSGGEQPIIDIHEWHKNVFGSASRDVAKIKFFAWLYNGNILASSGSKVIDSSYNKAEMLEKYWDGDYVNTPYGMKIRSDEKHALSYIVQSSAWSIFAERVIKLNEYIEKQGLKSKIFGMIHDCVILDYSTEDEKHMTQFSKIFSETNLGHFKISLKMGNNLGEMETLQDV